MTRKHFIAIANIFRTRVYDAASDRVRADLARDMADYLATQNPNFDRAKFLTACGVTV